MTYSLGGKQPALEPGSIVLVTGVTGLIGGNVADKVLEAGYKVRGTTRNLSRGQWAIKYFGKTYGKDSFELVEVKDMGDENAVKDAMKGVSGVAHVASDLSLSPDPNQVIQPTLAMMKAVLSAIAATPTVKRFVYTSSSTAITMPKPGLKCKVTLDDWNEEAVKEAWAPPPYTPERKWATYGASKTLCEQECWKFVKENKPAFAFNAILPNANFGRVLHKSQNASTAGMAAGVYQTGEVGDLADFAPQWAVDVEDTALLHLAALIDPDVQNERILAFAEPFNWNKILELYRELSPGRKFQDNIPNLLEDLMEVPNERGAQLLTKFGQRGFTTLKEMLKRTIEAYERNSD